MSRRLPRIVQRHDPERAEALARHGAITRERACQSKHRFETQRDARTKAKHVSREIGRPVATYHCPFCDGHHLTKLRHGEDAA
jgi:hypothetical protein